MFNVTSNGFDIQQTKSSAKIFDQSSNWEITLKELTIEEIEKKRIIWASKRLLKMRILQQ